MRTEAPTLVPPSSDPALIVDLVEALTALELNSEASRLHLGADLPDLRELRRLNMSALRDVDSIVQMLGQIRQTNRNSSRHLSATA